MISEKRIIEAAIASAYKGCYCPSEAPGSEVFKFGSTSVRFEFMEPSKFDRGQYEKRLAELVKYSPASVSGYRGLAERLDASTEFREFANNLKPYDAAQAAMMVKAIERLGDFREVEELKAFLLFRANGESELALVTKMFNED